MEINPRIPVMTQKSPYVETLRGFAILLVVMGHVIGDSVQGGMKVGDDSIWRYIYFNIDKLQMPLFTLIAGWVYAIRPFLKTQSFWRFAKQKSQRVLIPMLAVATIYYVLKAITGGEGGEQLRKIWVLLVFPYNVYWYLPSLFWLFIIAGLLDKCRWLEKIGPWAVILLASILLYKYQEWLIPEAVPNIFSLKGAIYLLPFFLLGMGIRRFNAVWSEKRLVTGLWCLFITCMVLVQLVWFQIIGDGYSSYGRNSWLGICTGLASAALFYSHVKIKALVWIGGFSYTIYLFHSIAKGICLQALAKLGVGNLPTLFVCSVIAGVLIPVFIDQILEKWKITRFVFLGKKQNKCLR
ncbi:MAG: acyltransferase [Bacteroidales bacterium]|jgi:fucose 4-O-acetylase-like acetyltransferase|nr:acyltransferase [Bacteroidales bacterium]